MKLERILPFARSLLEKAVSRGDIVVDATAGNGHDTLFLAKLVGEEGHVYAYDVQAEAIANTRERLLKEAVLDRVSLIHHGHESLLATIRENHVGKITGAIFNLGYLPGGDKSIVTRPESTISAMEQLLDCMKPEGVIVLVIYHGHEEGMLERDALMEYVSGLDQMRAHVLRYEFINQRNNPPFIVAIEKR